MSRNLSSPIRLQDCQLNHTWASWYAINMSLSTTVVHYRVDSAHCKLLLNLSATKDRRRCKERPSEPFWLIVYLLVVGSLHRPYCSYTSCRLSPAHTKSEGCHGNVFTDLLLSYSLYLYHPLIAHRKSGGVRTKHSTSVHQTVTAVRNSLARETKANDVNSSNLALSTY